VRRGAIRRARAHPVGVFAVLLTLFFCAFATWSWATPLFGAPDEPAHEIKAAAVVRGELVGRAAAGPSSPQMAVTVPRLYALASRGPSCFAFKVRVAASCEKPPSGGTAPTEVQTYVGRYPPLYYSVVGLPSLATVSPTGVYLMRLVSALLSAAFLALAATCIVVWSRSRLMLAGLALAATPSVFFFGGVINPSGLEITAAICLWCSSLVLVLERFKDPPRALLAIVGLSASVAVLCRGLSPLWVALIGLSVVGVAPRQVGRLVRRRDVQVTVGCIFVCAALATAWIFLEHALNAKPSINRVAPGTSELGIIGHVFGRTPIFLQQMIGEFGWLDTLSPAYTYAVWALGLGLIGALAIIFARARQLFVLVLVTVASVVVPVLLSASQARRLGFAWQGKDTLPLAVGIPILAAALAGSSSGMTTRLRNWLVTVVVALVASAQVDAFVQALRRNATGLPGPINYFNGPWRPPVGALAATVVFVYVWLLLAAVLWRCAPRPPTEMASHG
jgi:hypothetical protein